MLVDHKKVKVDEFYMKASYAIHDWAIVCMKENLKCAYDYLGMPYNANPLYRTCTLPEGEVIIKLSDGNELRYYCVLMDVDNMEDIKKYFLENEFIVGRDPITIGDSKLKLECINYGARF